MQFVNHKPPKIVTTHYMLGNTIYKNMPKNIPRDITPQPVQQNQQDPSNKAKWGEPTWFLFHTLAHKMKDEYVPTILPELYKIMLLIFSNLPCPKCANHATEYMSKIDSTKIRTKEDLKLLLFRFHNEVNKRKGYPDFGIDLLNDKYNAANTKNIIYYFMNVFKQKDFNISMITSNMYREQALKTFQQWISKNIGAFDP
jgi:hypothetical protein